MKSRLTHLAKVLRKRATKEEGIIWKRLRLHRMDGYKFKRQQPIGKYIVDFVCLEKMLIIEIDGFQHGFDENMKRDNQRDEWLKSEGYATLRFSNHEINRKLDMVMQAIWTALQQS